MIESTTNVKSLRPTFEYSTKEWKGSKALLVKYNGLGKIQGHAHDQFVQRIVTELTLASNRIHAIIEIPQNFDPEHVERLGDMVFAEFDPLLREAFKVIWVQRTGYYKVIFTRDVAHQKGSVFVPPDK